MAIRRRGNDPLTINIDGPDGNAYMLLGYAKEYARQLGRDPEPILADMKAKDYKHLLRVFNREFGCIVDLLTNNEEWLALTEEE